MENTMKEMIIAPITGQIISETTMGLDVPEFIEAEEVFENTIILILLSLIRKRQRLMR